MSEKYEELARSARCLARSTATPNWNAAKALFQATCTPYKIMEITEDFDRVTAERDALRAALEQSGDLKNELQQRLTAADERADVLEGLLREAMPALDLAASAFKSAMPVRSKVRAALKSAEAPRNQCDGCQAGIPIVNGHTGLWAAAMCPVHQGLRALKR